MLEQLCHIGAATNNGKMATFAFDVITEMLGPALMAESKRAQRLQACVLSANGKKEDAVALLERLYLTHPSNSVSFLSSG